MKLKLTLLLAIIANFTQAQLTINNVSATVAANYFVGSGVTISNATFTGDPTQLAEFSNGSSYFNFNQGIILTTGQAIYATQPNTYDGCGQKEQSPIPVSGHEVDLSQLITGTGETVFGPGVLEFDLVSSGTQVNFDFVFASEEYNEFVGDNWNDVFGLFISGPGINGTFSNNGINIALVPGTTDYISINNVNNGNAPPSTYPTGPCTNCAYFIDNSQDNTQNVGSGTLVYDGFTSTINASCTVQCGSTYHLRIAISNVNDNLCDAAVFLKKASLSSNFYLNPITTNAQPICEGQPLTLTIPGGNSTWNYSWSCNQSGTGLYSITTPASYNSSIYTVTVTNPLNGCTATESIDVNVHPLNNIPPYVNGIDNTGEYFACVQAGQQICFDIPSFDNPDEIISIVWSGGITGASFSSALGDVIAQHHKGVFCWTTNNSDIGIHTFTVTVTDNNVCGAESATYIFTVKVVCSFCPTIVYYENRTPSNNPLPSLTIAGFKIVAGTSVDPLQTDGDVNTGNATVTFRAPEIDLEPGFTAGPGFTAIADAGTCIDDCNTCCNSWSGFTYDFIPNVITPNGDGYNDVWYLPDVNHPYCAFNAQGFDLLIKNRWGNTIYHFYNNETYCCPFEAPSPSHQIAHSSIYWNGTDALGSIVSDGTYYYVLSLFGCGNEDSYNGSIEVITHSGSKIVDTTNNHYYTTSLYNLITSKDSVINIVMIGSDDSVNYRHKSNPISIYPNPTTGLIYIKLSDIKCKIFLFSIDGKLLLKKDAISKNESIDLNNFGSDTYIISIISDNNIFEQKVIKL